MLVIIKMDVVIGFSSGNMILKKIVNVLVLLIFVVFLSFLEIVEWMKFVYKKIVSGKNVVILFKIVIWYVFIIFIFIIILYSGINVVKGGIIIMVIKIK